MKKILMLSLCAFTLAGCSTAAETETNEPTKVETEEIAVVETSVELPTEDIGDGNFYIVNASGSSESDDVFEFYDAELLNPYLGFEGWDMDGSHKTFIYFDGELVGEELVSDTQSGFDIPMELYHVGTHTVTAIQYDDDTEEGTPLFVTNVDFEIKE